MTKRVLVTGASGHVGGALVADLVEHGYSVRASVRNPDDENKTRELKKLGVEIVKVDLFDTASLKNACKGMDGLFQVAAIYDMNPKNKTAAQKIIATGIEGMENALRAAASAGIKRVVLTSSCATITPVAKGAPDATEQSWVDDVSVPYIEEKTMGERHAWKLASELDLDMVSVLPGGVFGPGFNRSTPSTDVILSIAKGALRMGAPKINILLVDVRDVATVHRLAYEKGTSGGRYIALHSAPEVYDYVIAARKHAPSIGLPLMKMPEFMTGMVPIINAVTAKAFGFPQTYTRELHNSIKGREWRVNDSQTRTQLGFAPKYGPEETIKDTLEHLKKINAL